MIDPNAPDSDHPPSRSASVDVALRIGLIALLVYACADVSDAELASTLEIGWSEDGLKALLLINDQPHAAFDFSRRQGWCLTALPEAAVNKSWSKGPRTWSEDVEGLFD